MPKRTNEFQDLITSIYEQISSRGVQVTPTAMIHDNQADDEREVDILIEHEVSGHEVVIAIECRDRARKDTVEWIDSLIGKYDNTRVNKVVAVSKSGYTSTALKKAAANNIEALSIEEAVDTDWSTFPFKPKIKLCSEENLTLADVKFKEDSASRSLTEIGLSSEVYHNGKLIGSVKDLFEYIFTNKIAPNIRERIAQKRENIFKKIDDLNMPLYLEVDQKIEGLEARSEEGIFDITETIFIIVSNRFVYDLDLNHQKFNELMISHGKHVNPDGTELNCNLVQNPKSNQLHMRWTRTK